MMMGRGSELQLLCNREGKQQILCSVFTVFDDFVQVESNVSVLSTFGVVKAEL